jgi:hypothetical protein
MVRVVLLALACALLGGAAGTCATAPASLRDGGPNPNPPKFANVEATPGCDPSKIVDSADGKQVCATCDEAKGNADQICGAADSARCEARENANGASCSFCATADGQVLYDDCYATDPVQTADCETSPAPNGSTQLTSSNDSVCTTCTDASGAVVSTSCAPSSDSCQDTKNPDGTTCHVCTKGGVVVVKQGCNPSLAQPRSCEAYENNVGRCVDCFDDNDQLLSHQCTLSSDPNIACAQTATQDGLVCTTCTDSNGAVVDQSCNPQQPAAQACTELDYSEQTCIVCVDYQGNPAAWQCTSTTCSANDPSCAPPPDCTFDRDASGDLCRTCPNSSGSTEQKCVVNTNLSCTSGATDPSTGASCLSCTDNNTGVAVYKSCSGQPVPPACTTSTNAAGEQCSVCFDQSSKAVVDATCGNETCYSVGALPVVGAAGAQLFVGSSPAVAQCSECKDSAASNAGITTNAVCDLRSDCGATDLTNPDTWCSAAVVFTVTPFGCNNPWDAAGYTQDANTPAGGSNEIVHVLAYALEQQGVALIGVDDVGSATASGPTTTTCASDARGDTMHLAAEPADAVAVKSLFGSIMVACASDADCSTGGSCRADGSCTVP